MWLSFSALHNLRTQFRLVVTQRLEARVGFGARWLGRKPVSETLKAHGPTYNR
jgi:hypothetical protein